MILYNAAGGPILTYNFWLHTSMWFIAILLGHVLSWIFIMTAKIEYVEYIEETPTP